MKSEWAAEMRELMTNETAGVYAYQSISGPVTSFGSITLGRTKTGTIVTAVVDYQLPYSVLGKIMDRLKSHKAFEKSFETSAANSRKCWNPENQRFSIGSIFVDFKIMSEFRLMEVK